MLACVAGCGRAPDAAVQGGARVGGSAPEAQVAADPEVREGVRAAVPLTESAEDAEDATEDSPAERAGSGAAAGDAAGEPGAMAPATVDGLPATVNRPTVDGLSGGQAFGARGRESALGGVRPGAVYGAGAFGRLQVSPRAFTADIGGAGAEVSLTTLPGWAGPRAATRGVVHGSVFGTLRESAWAAANPFALATRYNGGAVTVTPVKPRDAWGDFGLVLAGSGAALPGLRWRALERVQFLAAIGVALRSDPVISTPAVPGFFVLSASQKALLANRGATEAETVSALSYLDSLMGPTGRSSQRVRGLLRVDLPAGGRGRLFAEWAPVRGQAAGAGAASNAAAVTPRGRASLADQRFASDVLLGAWTHAWGPHWTSDVRAQTVRDEATEAPRGPLPQEPAIGPGGFAPEVSIGPNGFAYGTPAGVLRGAYPDETRAEAALRVEGAFPHHLVALGADWSRIGDLVESATNSEGTFSYDAGVTGGHAGGLVDWITDDALGVNAYPNAGCPSVTAAVHRFCFRSFTQTFGAMATSWTTHEFAAYAEDGWQVRDNVRVTAGVRWEYTLLPLPQQPNAALDAGLLALSDPRAGTTASFPEDRNNFGPRLAVVWNTHWAEVRLGYGGFFGQVPGATVRAALTETALPSGIRRVRITPATEVGCPQQPGVSFGYPCDFTAAPPDAVLQTARALVFARGFRVPAVQRMSLGAERRLGKHAALELGYAGAVATQLPGTVDLNIAPAVGEREFVVQGPAGVPGAGGGTLFSVPLYTARRWAAYGPVSAVTSTANATFHAGRAELRMDAGGWTLRAGYVFSHAIDYAPQAGAAPRTMTVFDPFAQGYDKGRSSLDFPERFSGAAEWRPECDCRGRPLLRALGEGWTVSAMGVAGSGAPYSYGIFGGTYLPGGRETINGSGGATYLPTVGRNSLRLPPRGWMDLRVTRVVRAGRGAELRGFAEAFNLLNQRSLTRVEARAFLLGTAPGAGAPTPLVFQDAATVAAEGVSTPAFGSPLSSSGGAVGERRVELGFRLAF